MAETDTLRVALLARPGAACDRLCEALREASADVVLVADPTQADPDGVAGAGAQAVLVALEPSIEDALERFDDVLADPALTVLYEEVELAANRAGWDAARWVRHLAAKLHRHDDVLPPGTEAEPEFDIEAGRLSLYRAPEAKGDLSGIAGEALGLAGAVPRDGFDGVNPPPATSWTPPAVPPPPPPPPAPAAGPVVDADADTDADIESGDPQPVDAGRTTGDTDQAAMQPNDFSLPQDEAIAPESGPAPVQPDVTDKLAGIDPALLHDDLDDDATSARFHQDMADLHQRISGLELVNNPREIAAEASGAVAILAGLGGPDAVRQLLGALPVAFPRPVLIQQRLDGARHDKLVRQMQRATEMPVELAEAGNKPQATHVYILPAGVGVVANDDGLAFAAIDDASAFAALPAGDSALILLSGSDPAMVDVAMGLSLRGAIVAGQSPDGCYDATAAQALIARGAESGAPTVLARKLAVRWPA